MEPRSRLIVQRSALMLLVLTALALRWAYRGHYLEGWDSVDFALALHDFDLEKFQPHFPGYLPYIATARAIQFIAGNEVIDDTTAIILPGIIFSSLAVIPIALLASRWTELAIPTTAPIPIEGVGTASMWAGLIAAGLYLLSPGLWLQAEKPLSDALGYALLPWVLLAFLYGSEPAGKAILTPRHWAAITGILMGIVLGTRLSYWPFVVGLALILLIHRPLHLKTFVLWVSGGLSAGICLWFLPLVAHTGTEELFQEAIRFINGHFTRWGGTAFSSDAEMSRYATWAWGILAFSLGGYWPDAPQNIWRILFSITFGTLLIFAIAHRSSRKITLTVAILCAPYLCWILLAQNPDRPRHALPLILFLYPMLGAAVGIWMKRGNTLQTGTSVVPTIGLIAMVCSSFITLPLVKSYAETTPPQVAFIKHIQERFDPHTTRVFTWETHRLFTYYAPSFHATRELGLRKIHEEVNTTKFDGTVLFSSKLRQRHSKRYCFEYLETFRRLKYVEPWFWTLSLFSYCGSREELRPHSP